MASFRFAQGKDFGKRLWAKVNEDHVSIGAAALAFNLVLALFPAAIFGLSLLPYLPIPHLQEAIMDLVGQALPGPTAQMLTKTVDAVLSKRNSGLLSFGLLFMVWSASSGLYALMQQMNVVYGVEEERSFLKARGVALLLTLSFFVLVVGALGLVVFGGVLQAAIAGSLGWSVGLRVVFATLRWVIIVLAMHLALALVYHFGPHLPGRRFVLITPGSVCATLGLLLASMAFKLYVSQFGNYDALYGSLGAVIVLLLWLFVTGWVILLGGELNDILDPEREGRGPRARPHSRGQALGDQHA